MKVSLRLYLFKKQPFGTDFLSTTFICFTYFKENWVYFSFKPHGQNWIKKVYLYYKTLTNRII
jgi:hypothetical protein